MDRAEAIKAMKSLQDNLGVDRSEENLTTEAATHDKRTETHGVCSDLISRQAAIEAVDETWWNARWIRKAIESLPSADTDMSEYSDRLWIAAYDRGKAAMSQYVLDILDLMLDEDMVARIREWIWSERDGENTTTTESKLKNPCDSLLTADPDECKEHKSKLDLIDRMEAIAVLRNIELGNIPCTIGKDIIHGLPPVTPAERTGWIPVSERLPKVKQEVYVTVYFTEGDYGRAYGYIDGFGGWHLYSTVEGTLNSGYEVTAWMPLPEPYKGGDSE